MYLYIYICLYYIFLYLNNKKNLYFYLKDWIRKYVCLLLFSVPNESESASYLVVYLWLHGL